MENRTEFNLDKSITIWKSQLSKNSNFTGDNINELESHLLDEIQGLNEIGLNNEESFLVASKRIGTVEQLTIEFSKVNRKVYFRSRILPFLKGILAFIAFMTVTELLTNTSVLIGNKLELNGNQFNWLSIGVLIFLSLIPFIVFYNKYKKEKFNMRIITNIPFLVITIVITKLLTIFSLISLTHNTIGIENFGILRVNFSVFELSFVVLILIVSSILFYSNNKDKKVKFAV